MAFCVPAVSSVFILAQFDNIYTDEIRICTETINIILSLPHCRTIIKRCGLK